MNEAVAPIRVDIVSDVVCPWCAIGYAQLARASDETGIALDVHWHPFELNPDMAEDGENLRDHLAAKYGTTPEESKKARARLTDMGAALGFTFSYADDMRMWNTFRAHQLIEWATERDRGHDMKLALFEAFFTRRENVSDIEVLSNVAASIGLDHVAARNALMSGTLSAMVREKERFWTSRGVQGVPAMVFQQRYLVSGAQGEGVYSDILRQLRSEAAA